jgi:uracil-DNA glycosylase family 4
MFIAEMPSMRGLKNDKELLVNDNFKGDKLLNETMAKYGVGGSYVTDIVKERGIPGRPTYEQIKEWLPFLLKEIDIIKPKYIVVLGKGNYFGNFKTWVEPRIDKSIKVDWVFHYSTRVPRLKFEQRFREVINRLK